MRLSAIVTVLVILGHSAPAFAQQTGVVMGRVIDQTGAALPGVTVDVTAGNTELTTITDDDGRYRFDRLPAGRAEVTFRLINFTVQRRTMTVIGGEPAIANAMLHLSLKADVVVTGRSTFRNVADIENPAENLVGIAAAASQGAITAAQLETRPIMRAGEVLETVPGMMVSQHSGTARPTSITCGASTSITAPTFQRRLPACR